MVSALEVRGLCKQFGVTPALHEVGFRVAPGEMVALIGASGSGKSTLLRHIPAFVSADAGDIEVFGRPTQAGGRIVRNIREIRREVGFVFQQFNLVNRLPVVTNVMIGGLQRTGFLRSMTMRFTLEERRKAIAALTDVGIERTAWQRAGTLSGGQQQRAALARCLVQGARLILADEPIASLDPESSRKVMELLVALNRRHGCSVVVSLHQVEFAVQYCPRTIALRAGRVVYDGPSSDLTVKMLGDLYGSEAHELFERALVPGARPAEDPVAMATATSLPAAA